MQVYNMLEKTPRGYKAGNIRLVKIHPGVVEVFTRSGEVLRYLSVVVPNSKPLGGGEKRSDFDCRESF